MFADAEEKEERRAPTAPLPICPIDDGDAALYFGHLAAQAEIALPRSRRESQIATTWLTAHVASQKSRLWAAEFEDLALADQPIGSWTLTARMAPCPRQPIELVRRPWLAEDGRQVIALAHPFLDSENPSGSDDDALRKLVDFASMQLIATLAAGPSSVVIRDCIGNEITFQARPIRKIKDAAKVFFRSITGR